MLAARSLLLLAVFGTFTFGCARRNKVNIPEAKSVAVAPATPAPVPKAAARDLADVMTDELGLSTDQQTKVRAILKSTVEQVNDARQRLGTDKTALNTELRRINTSAESDLRTVLSATQYKEYQAKKRTMQTQMQAKRAVK
ncbi:hypothetical protein SAMN02745146_3149 [Hymenobacter daecheongensis DSM 21074]|uniref:LTXXQ motif family protein n=1 Tax=Hymenobacter daecheongensis DSM 21074 TaxID=1121955 RepID=A0A1M6J969_9BACT|nr:hypothetical protein [Hymenobacter daecheongensis]SHJ43204.1 hypothetical protein SAMN02745146_3149 [Hymenobacter daecheongensis DSM 21074]